MTKSAMLHEHAERFDNRESFSSTLVDVARSDERVVAVCNDSVGSSKLTDFAAEFGDRLVNVGIAEQNLVGVAAGLAATGLIPFVCSAGSFLSGRALEQVKADVAYSQHPVVLCAMSPGMAYGELGATHHSIEDLSWIRALPDIDLIVPADRHQTEQAIRQLASDPRPAYLRIGRFKVPDVTSPEDSLQRGRFNLARDGTDAIVVATGTLVSESLIAAERLAADGIDVRVLNAAYITPLDVSSILEAASTGGPVVVAEEAAVTGGLGAAVASVIAQSDLPKVPVRLLGTSGFAPTGSNSWLLSHFGLDAAAIARTVREVVDR